MKQIPAEPGSEPAVGQPAKPVSSSPAALDSAPDAG